jgi:Skp family chaperone for outer membrane proteins
MRAFRAGLVAATLGALAVTASPSLAQDQTPAQTPAQTGIGPVPLPAPSSVRILDQDRLLRASRLGQALLADLRAAEQALERENQILSDQLAAEERALTDLRGTLEPDEFRARADAFDRRVETIRAERGRLAQDLARRYDAEAQRFFQSALPILTRLMEDEGILAILNPEAVILGADRLDITDEAIRRLDAATAP